MNSTQTYSTIIDGVSISQTAGELRKYLKQFIFAADIIERISNMLAFEVYVHEKAFGVDPSEIFQQIKNLENGTITGVKPATQFKHLPLKGLWHQHFFSAQFVINNIVLGLGKSGIETLINEVFSRDGSPIITREMIDEVSHRVVHDPLNARIEQNKITGEWIIFIIYDDVRYYLCISTHQADDESVFTKILESCVLDFENLPLWIDHARSS